MKIPGNTLFCKDPDVVTRDIAGETLLVPIKGHLVDMRQLFALEGVADFVWKNIDGINTVDDLCDLVTSRFEVDRAEATADVDEFLSSLKESGLITGVS